MEYINIYTILFLSLLFLSEINILLICGWYITKPIDVSNFKINPHSENIISDSSFHFASKSLWFSLSSKWYIYGKGRVLRFSKLHNQLEKKYKELKNNG